MTPCPKRNTEPLIREGFKFNNQKIWEKDGCKVYPPEFFSPINYHTRELVITDNTYSIHHYSATWISEGEKNLSEKLEQIDTENSSIVAFFLCQKEKYQYEKKIGNCSNPLNYLYQKVVKKLVLH